MLLVLCIARSACAQTEPTTLPATGDSLTVYLATMEPGDEPWERFAHDAIIILDHSTNESWAYNYGVFDFDAPNFIGNFIRGKMTYWMDVDPAEPTIAMYARANRSVWLDELNLSPAQRLKLFQMLEENRKPANKFYRYDYYRDNCTTRVRDSLDRTLDGEISRQLKGIPTGTTYRWHTRIGMADYFWLYTGLELIMGPACDRKLSAWEESFLPAKLMEHLKSVMIDDGAGHQVPLVKQSIQIFNSTRTPLPMTPPTWWWGFLLVGIALGGVILLAAQNAFRKTVIGLAIFWSLVCTLASIFMICLWLFTDHEAGYRNENLLIFSPFSFLVLIAAIRAWRSKIARILVMIPLALGVLSLVMKAIPWAYEWNWEMIALALPIHAGLAAAVVILQNKSLTPQTNPEVRGAKTRA